MKSSRGIHYQLDGDEKLPVLVFSNSLGTDLSMWDFQAEQFKKDFHILRYDSRGHGGSDEISSKFTIADLGEDLLQLMDELQIKKAHYCGLSIGGFTGIWLGSQHPERFKSLTLANTAPRISTAEVWEKRIELVQKEGLEPVAKTSASRWFTEKFIHDHPEVVDKISENLKQTRRSSYIGCCEVLRDTNLWSFLPLINIPTLVIAGDQDPVSGVLEAQKMVANIKSSRLSVLPASHLSNLEGDSFNESLRDFLSMSK